VRFAYKRHFGVASKRLKSVAFESLQGLTLTIIPTFCRAFSNAKFSK